jgi:hypothetical protein
VVHNRLMPDEILILVTAGASVSISIEGWTAQDLAHLVKVASSRQVHVTLRRIDLMSADTLLHIVSGAQGHVTLQEA